MEKLFLKFNDDHHQKTLDAIQQAFDLFNGFSIWFKESGIDAVLPQETIIKWCKEGMTDENLNEYLKTQFTDQNNYIANVARKMLYQDLKTFPQILAMGMYQVDFSRLTFKDGLTQFPKGLFEKLKEEFKVYLTDPEAIRRRLKHLSLVEELNTLANELRPNNSHYGDNTKMLTRSGLDGEIMVNDLFLIYD